MVLTLEQVEVLGHIKRCSIADEYPHSKSEGDTLSAPLLVPRDIPTDPYALQQIKKLADAQSALPLFMFSKDHRFGALSIQTDFGTIPILDPDSQNSPLLEEDAWDEAFDNFEVLVDEEAYR